MHRVAEQRDLQLAGGRTLHTYSGGAGADDARLAVVWHHGSPQTGALLPPLLRAADERGIRLLSYGRPSYGGSSPRPGRDAASAASDVAALADAYGVERFAVVGASGGGPHALASAALLPDRVTGVACLAGIAPLTGEPEWWAGMASPGGLRAAVSGRDARAAYAEIETFDEASFTSADWAALEGEWGSLGQDAGLAGRAGPDGLIDDDVAFTRPWGFELEQVEAPVLLVQGGEDRIVPRWHAEAQLRRLPRGELWLRPRDGHISVLLAVPVAFDWLLDVARAPGKR